MSNRLAIFDCDGTLVDSGAMICSIMDRCFTDAGLAPPGDASRRVVGLSLYEAMQILHPEGAHDLHLALVDGYRAHARAHHAAARSADPLFDGIAETLAMLDDRGWLLGVATGNSDKGLARCLDHHGLTRLFATLQTADRHPSKPHPSMIEQAIAEAGAAPATTVMIGDTEYDMAMARSAGVAAIGVAWGYHHADELRRAGADFVAEHPRDLIGLLEEFW